MAGKNHNRTVIESLPEETPLLAGQVENSEVEQNAAEDLSVWQGTSDFDGLPWWRTPSVYWLLPGFFLLTTAFGGILVPRVNLVLALMCRDYLADQAHLNPHQTPNPIFLFDENPECQVPSTSVAVQKMATKFNLYLTLISGLLAAISSPKLGELSDRYGRLRMLCIVSVGGVISEIIYILCAGLPDVVHYNWLLLGAFADGICGSFITSMAITNSYTSDITAPHQRSVTFGYIHACFFAGIAVGPFLAGYITQVMGTSLGVFYGALGLHLLFLLFLGTVVPESLSKKRQMAARERYALTVKARGPVLHTFWQDFGAIRDLFLPLKILWPTGPGTSSQVRLNLLLLAIVDAIIFGVAMAAMGVVVFYIKLKFQWTEPMLQTFIGATAVSRVLALLVILPLMTYLFRTRRINRERRASGVEPVIRNSGSDNLDLYVIRFALFLEVLGYTIYSLAQVDYLFFIGGLIAAFGGLGAPILQSALTKHVPADRVGQVLGATGLLHAIGRVLGPIVFSGIYYATVDTVPQTVLVVLGASFGVAFLVSWFLRPHVYIEDVEPHVEPTSEERARDQHRAERVDDEEYAQV